MITIDSREPEHLKLFLTDMIGAENITIKALEFGDYNIHNKFIIERKTYSDLVASLKNNRENKKSESYNRFYNQMTGLANKYQDTDTQVILAVTDMQYKDDSQYYDSVGYSLIASTFQRYGFSVLTFNNDTDFFRFIKALTFEPTAKPNVNLKYILGLLIGTLNNITGIDIVVHCTNKKRRKNKIIDKYEFPINIKYDD